MEQWNLEDSKKVIRIPVQRKGEHARGDPPASPRGGVSPYGGPLPLPPEKDPAAPFPPDVEQIDHQDSQSRGKQQSEQPEGFPGEGSNGPISNVEAAEAQYRGLLSDYDNFRKRVQRDAQQQSLNEKKAFLLEFLEIMDNFERALAVRFNGGDDWRRGVEAIEKQMRDLLERHGVTPIKAVGRPFNPHLHEAVSTTSLPGVEDGLVVGEIRKGYELNGELLRPSRVQVSVKQKCIM